MDQGIERGALILLLVLAGGLPVLGQTGTAPSGSDRPPEVGKPGDHRLEFLRRPYQPKPVTSVDDRNSGRIYDLIRANHLYLSLDDAIALAIENNLETQIARYQIPISGTDLLRTKGGGTPRGVSLSTTELPVGVGGPPSPLVNAAATGTTPSTTLPNSIYDLSLLSTTAVPLSLDPSSLSSPLPSAAGPPIPQYDPLITGSFLWSRQTTPESNTLVAGTSILQTKSTTGSLNLQQGFGTGTQYSLGFSSMSQNSTSTRNSYNPLSSGSLGLTVTQPLLRGFGVGVNRRYINIAKNDQRISDLVFRQQAINVIYGVSTLYYDLAGLNENVRVKRETLTAAQSLYKDTKARVDEGTLADVELTRAEAQVAGAEQDLINSQGLFEEEEAILKNVLTRRGSREPAIEAAHIVPTDALTVPADQALPEMSQLLPQLLTNRPDLQQATLELANSELTLKGTRNQLLPELDLIGTVQSSGLSGQPNALQTTSSTTGGVTSGSPDPALTGGYGNMLSQILQQRYPTYEAGIQLNLPIRNRVAQADMARDELALRAYRTRFLLLQNQAELEAQDALIALRRARAAYDAAVRTRKLQAQSLDVEQARYEAGVSTASLVLQYQSYLSQAEATELVARGDYFKANAALERATGTSLEHHNITMQEAYTGKISRESKVTVPDVPVPAVVTPQR